jgi:hypothetical protein
VRLAICGVLAVLCSLAGPSARADAQVAEPASAAAPQPTAAGTTATAAPESHEAELSYAELSDLGFDGGPDAVPIDTAIKIYGFTDFSAQFIVGSSAWRASLQRHPSFYIGNFNIYISKQITSSLRAFSEVRLMYLPSGSRNFDAVTEARTSTAARDYADHDRPIRWGAIEIERVYLDWLIAPFLTLRAGQFLTPYGIWNVDHGSPTVIPVNRPFIVGQQLFPERQTGLELFGSTKLSANHTVVYNLTLSNGFGPVSEYRDLDDNKAIGAHLHWQYEGFGELRVGASGFYGRDTDALEIAASVVPGEVKFREHIVMQSDVLSLAADLQWKYRNLLVQAELITQQRLFTDGGRSGAIHPLLGRYVAPKDTLARGGYVLVGYRFDWLGIMPYCVVSDMDFVDPIALHSVFAVGVTGGLNIRPVDSVVLKLEYMHAWWPDGSLITSDPTQVLNTQLAWAF